MSGIYLGTSAFTAAGWPGSFYPAGMQPRDYLGFYSTKFDTVEVDSTFYRCPSTEMVRNWGLRTTEGFLLSSKVPKTITHEKILIDCDAEFETFVDTMDILDEKLGPMVFQFPYFNKEIFQSDVQFFSRLKVFFKKLPKDYRFAVEIRNKHWLRPKFLDLLREHNVALVLQDQSWMPRPAELFERFDPITADFTYIRWLGDRKGIEAVTKTWDKVVVDRASDLQDWVKVCHQMVRRGVTVFGYANNHYAGHAPATIQLFREMCERDGIPVPLQIHLPEPFDRTMFENSAN
ncbi:MAG TPA: DUF72 domain-containing protein [Candidatus Acidoferrales bacterium]|nr:DUF72 domain-containing protein [Candidatus Acidoferrales bacterium]